MIRFRFRLVYYNAYNWIVTLFFLINKMFLLPIKIKNKKNLINMFVLCILGVQILFLHRI